jgi:hypothetical protein
MMSWLWNALKHSFFLLRTPTTMTHHDGFRRDMAERRLDAASADIVQVGICFMRVFGRDNAEAYFHGTEIEPAVYRRVIAGRFRAAPTGRGPGSEPVPA